MTTNKSTACPFCGDPMNGAHLYVRGLGASLHLSSRADVGLMSRNDLQQINLDNLSRTDTGAQAVIPVLNCTSCGSVSLRTAM